VVAGELPPARTDHARLGPLVEQGWRLACQHIVKAPLTVLRAAAIDL
jgi:hypothetical protein